LYEKDGATFRRKVGASGVQDVLWPDGQWHEYQGEDAIGPIMFGDFLREEDMPDERIAATVE
jgi:hypothetical protein